MSSEVASEVSDGAYSFVEPDVEPPAGGNSRQKHLGPGRGRMTGMQWLQEVLIDGSLIIATRAGWLGIMPNHDSIPLTPYIVHVPVSTSTSGLPSFHYPIC